MGTATIRRPLAARPLSGFWRGLALAAAYFAAGKLALLLAIPPGYATAVWPPAGIALAGVLLYGPGIALGVWLGSFLTNIATAFDTADVTRSVTVASMIAFGAALQAMIGGGLIRRTVGSPGPLVREIDVIRFLVLGGPVSCLVSAACGVATLTVSGVIPPDAAAFSGFTWWIGDTIGVLIFAPLVLMWFGEPRDTWRARQQLSQTTDALEQELHDREQAEHALRSSENQLRSVTESENDTIIIADPDGRILRWNQAAERCFGYSEEEALGQRVVMLIPERLRAAHEAGLVRLREGGVPRLIDRTLEIRGLRKDGIELPLEISLSTWCSDDGTFYCGILRDISERQRAELELQRAKEAAEAGNRAKGDFLANMSHEIRTPMNAVIGMTGLLRDTPLDPQQREFVETIRTSGNHLLTVINEILDLSKIEAGHFELEISRFDVRRCVEEAIGLIAPRAAEKQLALSQRIAAGVPPAISSDAGRLRQVLVNLIDNAVKFTDSGSVEVAVTEARVLSPADGDRARCELHFWVRDTGLGIPEGQVDRLFEPFTQADASVSRRFGGTGLGLTISKRLCERLGGRIWVESEVGRGSTFHFTIVARAEAMPDAVPAAAPPVAIGSGAGQHEETPRLRILLAEDNAVNQRVAKLLLEQLGYRDVDAVGNGIEVIAALERQSYDLVLMDVQMPEMDGIDATRWIRGRWKRVPKIIALTAYALSGDRERFIQAGMDGYLAKPIQLAELAAELTRVCAVAAAPSAARPRPPQGRQRLASLLAQIPDVPVVSQIVDDFAGEARAAESGLRRAFAEGDAKSARRISHTLASTAAMVGASELAVLAREIERLAAADDAAGAIARMRGLGAAVEEALGAVIAERDALMTRRAD